MMYRGGDLMRQNRIRPALGRLLFLLALVSTLTACAPDRHPADVVGDILAEAPVSFPAGMVESRLSDDTLATLFGATAVSEEMAAVESYCIYMASRNGPVEIALFQCYAASGTRAVSRMLLRRSDLLAPYLPDGISARVAVLGRHVILAVCEDPDAAIAAARRSLRGS